jgi:predicted GNAT superfamily acetyltransferase
MKYLGLDLIRGENPSKTAEFLGPYLILSSNQKREFYVAQLKQLLQTMGDSIFALCAFDSPEDKEPELMGFVVSYLNMGGHCFLAQCWVDAKKAPHGTSQVLYHEVLKWAEAKGCTKILGELQGDHDERAHAVFRKWGFKTYAYAIEVDLTDEYTAKQALKLTKEIENHGIRQQHTADQEREQSDSGTEADGLGSV